MNKKGKKHKEGHYSDNIRDTFFSTLENIREKANENNIFAGWMTIEFWNEFEDDDFEKNLNFEDDNGILKAVFVICWQHASKSNSH